MLIRDKMHFLKGLLLAISFFVILIVMFMPFFGTNVRTNMPRNAMEAADDLFNSISKGSIHYIPDLLKKSQAVQGTSIDVSIKLKSNEMTQNAVKLLTAAGLTTAGDGTQIKVHGDLSKILVAALKDSDELFFNRSMELEAKYGFGGREVIFVWWNILKEIDKDLTRQSKFKESKFVGDVIKKGVEVAFNFYGIEPQSVVSKAGILAFALVFYVIYTLWWGVAIFYMFEGIGLQMKAGAKKEV